LEQVNLFKADLKQAILIDEKMFFVTKLRYRLNGVQIFNTRADFENRVQSKGNQTEERARSSLKEERSKVVLGNNQSLNININNHYVPRIYPNLRTSHQEMEDLDLFAMEELFTENEQPSNVPHSTNSSTL
jgi:hypothetical protein